MYFFVNYSEDFKLFNKWGGKKAKNAQKRCNHIRLLVHVQ